MTEAIPPGIEASETHHVVITFQRKVVKQEYPKNFKFLHVQLSFNKLSIRNKNGTNAINITNPVPQSVQPKDNSKDDKTLKISFFKNFDLIFMKILLFLKISFFISIILK
jgi:hypothetical protein